MKPIITYRRLITPLALLLLCSAPAYSMTWGKSAKPAATTAALAGGGGGGAAAAAPDESAKIAAAVSSAIATPGGPSASTILKRSYAEAAKSGLVPAGASLYATATTTPSPVVKGNVTELTKTIADLALTPAAAPAIPVSAESAAPAAAVLAGTATAEVKSEPKAPAAGITAQPSIFGKLLGYVWATDPVTQMRAGTLTPAQTRVHDIENCLQNSIAAKNTADVMTVIDWLAANPDFVINRTFAVAATNYLDQSKKSEVSSVTHALNAGEVQMVTAATTIMHSCTTDARTHSEQAHRIKQAQTKARNLAKASGAKADTVGDDAAYSDDEAYVRPHEVPAAVNPETLLKRTFADARSRYTVPAKVSDTRS